MENKETNYLDLKVDDNWEFIPMPDETDEKWKITIYEDGRREDPFLDAYNKWKQAKTVREKIAELEEKSCGKESSDYDDLWWDQHEPNGHMLKTKCEHCDSEFALKKIDYDEYEVISS